MQDAHELRCGSVAAAERAYALGYASVALETICDAARAKDANPLNWGAPRDVDAPTTTPRLRLLKRLTVRLDAPRISVPQKVLNAFDLVAVVPETDDAFRAACSCNDVDISVACGARLPFSVARKDVEVAIKRGAAFEVSYAHAIAQPRSLRHLTATGLRLAALTNGGRGLVLSCGSSDAWRVRSPGDTAALAAMLGVRNTDGVVGASAARAVKAGAARLYAAGADDSWLDGDEIKMLIGPPPSGKRRRRK
jgi:RNase P/RNase MRP subunit p30